MRGPVRGANSARCAVHVLHRGTEHGLANSAAPVVTKPASMGEVMAVLAPLIAGKVGKRATLRLFS